jgi:micrococcal nuclease
MFQYLARVVNIIDGDTLKLDIDLGFKVHVLETVRLAHIDTPETINYRATGLSDPAKIYIADNVPIGSYCVVEITRQEKYGRWLADLFFCPGVSEPLEILKNPRVLNDELVRQGFAKRYEGGKK